MTRREGGLKFRFKVQSCESNNSTRTVPFSDLEPIVEAVTIINDKATAKSFKSARFKINRWRSGQRRGRRFNLSTLVVVGDGKRPCRRWQGFEVPEAIRKALSSRFMVQIQLMARQSYHDQRMITKPPW